MCGTHHLVANVEKRSDQTISRDEKHGGVVEIRDRRHVQSGQRESGRRDEGVTVRDKDSDERYSNDVAEKLGG